MKWLKCNICGWEASEKDLFIEITPGLHCPGCGGFLEVQENGY